MKQTIAFSLNPGTVICQELERGFRKKIGFGGNFAWHSSFCGETCDQKFNLMLRDLTEMPKIGRLFAVY